MKRIFLLLLLVILAGITGAVHARPDDITLPGPGTPIFFLDEPFSETILTAEDKEAEFTVSSVSVEKERILIRFYVTGLEPASWRGKITDNNRLYGSYLPAAELVLDSGTFLTPSSASRYSYLEFNSMLIIGGLLIFETNEAPQAFYFNFNQIPFDVQPLSEGITKAVILSTANTAQEQGTEKRSDIVSDAEFTLTAAAQSCTATMLQPSVRMLREDESLTKFGWIAISDLNSGKQYAVTRGNLYGFNLTDDDVYSPAHAYVFSPLRSEDPVRITMDHLYAERTFSSPQQCNIDLQETSAQLLLRDEGLTLSVTGIRIIPEEERIRLYIDSGETAVSDISFQFADLGGTVQPLVTCGSDPAEGQFACDIFFSENAFPEEHLEFSLSGIEYRKDGPWQVIWNPAAMEPAGDPEPGSVYYPLVSDNSAEGLTVDIPEEVRPVVSSIGSMNENLKTAGKWIHESYLVSYDLSDEQAHTLIPVSQAEQYYTRYVSEQWLFVSEDLRIHEIFTIVRDPDDRRILSAQWEKDDSILDLIHGLKAETESKLNYDYSCGEDFEEILGSSAVFTGISPCGPEAAGLQCLHFSQSLSGIPDGPGSQAITFAYDPDAGLIRQQTIDYDRGSLFLTRTLLELSSEASLPDDITALTGSFK